MTEDIVTEKWRRAVTIRAFFRKRVADQIGKEQSCTFCSAQYSFADGEAYRPEAVCADCWPRISEIEKKHHEQN